MRGGEGSGGEGRGGEGRGDGREDRGGGEGKNDLTHPLSQIPGYATVYNGLSRHRAATQQQSDMTYCKVQRRHTLICKVRRTLALYIIVCLAKLCVPGEWCKLLLDLQGNALGLYIPVNISRTAPKTI